MCRDWSALMGFTAMAKLTRKAYSLSSSHITLSQAQDFRFSPYKTYCTSNAARRGWVIVEVEDNDYYGGGAMGSFAIRRDQARRLRADLRAERREVVRNMERLPDRPLLAFDFDGDDTPF